MTGPRIPEETHLTAKETSHSHVIASAQQELDLSTAFNKSLGLFSTLPAELRETIWLYSHTKPFVYSAPASETYFLPLACHSKALRIDFLQSLMRTKQAVVKSPGSLVRLIERTQRVTDSTSPVDTVHRRLSTPRHIYIDICSPPPIDLSRNLLFAPHPYIIYLEAWHTSIISLSPSSDPKVITLGLFNDSEEWRYYPDLAPMDLAPKPFGCVDEHSVSSHMFDFEKFVNRLAIALNMKTNGVFRVLLDSSEEDYRHNFFRDKIENRYV
ncbi:hypothetical protein Ptr902_01495 [Pyrenophora tritici-repentis]|nr:hypothetical protein Ptr902_01495 [Pyrenophora tritici-repentis]